MRIGISGSMQFIEKQMELAKQLRALGHDVFLSDFAEEYAGKSDEEKERQKIHDKNTRDAIREYWKPMQNADALLVANLDKHGIPNYIGGNAFLEMGFAYVLEQKIFLLNPMPDMPYYGTEIAAMKPIVIHGDLSNIK